MDTIEVYITYEEISGSKLDINFITEVIRRHIDPLIALPILSQLASDEKGPKNAGYKDLFIAFLRKWADTPEKRAIMAEKEKLIKTRHLYAYQAVLTLWKFILNHVDVDKFKHLDREITDDDYYWQFITVLNLLVMIADHLTPHDDLVIEMFRNYMFHHKQNFGSSMSRTSLVYTTIAKQKELFEEAEFFDINQSFYELFGYSIEEYIYVLLSMYTLFHQKLKSAQNRLTPDWFQNIQHSFNETNLAIDPAEVIDPLTFTIDDYLSDAGEQRGSWDFAYFVTKPFFKLGQDSIFPIRMDLIENALVDGLFWKIRDAYPQSDRAFQSFFGKPFELYVQEIVMNAIQKSKLPYDFIPEFKYSGRKSPDVMLKLGGVLIAIEVKAKRLNFLKSVIEGDAASIESDRQKMTVLPMKQLYNRVKEIMREKIKGVADGVKEIHLIIVTQGTFPTIMPIEIETKKEWGLLQGIDCPVYMHRMDIEEIEMLCALLEKDKPVFKFLRHFEKHSDRLPIKDVMYYGGNRNIRMTQRLHTEHKRLFTQAVNYLFKER